VLHHRLLLAARGGGSFTAPVIEDEDMRVVAFLTRLSNIVVAEDTTFPFDTARLMDTDYCTWAGEDAPIVIVQEGWYVIHGNFTTLGTFYGGPSNARWFAFIGRNGNLLADTIAGELHSYSSTGADLMSIGTIEWLEAGDEITVYFQNATGTGLLVESNPSDGPDYTTDTGPGTISPHLILARVAGNAPS
jgi:hypothetical protein